MSKKVYKETYFPHDRYARRDTKIKNLLVHFRRESEIKAQAAVCIYWWIVEDMHTDDYPVNKLEAFADDYRCDVDFLKSILNDFELFRIEDDCYISDRVLRNIKEQEEKSEKARNSVRQRWNNKGDKKDDAVPDIADEVIVLFNETFNKELTVSKENRKRINEITKENNLTSEDWQKIIKNAKRGWDIEGKNKKPDFRNILKNWDAFKSDDYNLAPDYEAIEAAKEEKRKAREAEAEAEREAQREEAAKQAEYEEEKENAYNAISDKYDAIEWLNKYLPDATQRNIDFLIISRDFKTLAARFGITAHEVNESYVSKQPQRIGF